jgi:hypothetical protein
MSLIFTIFGAIWHFIYSWLYLFYAPLKNLDMLWIIIPIYLSWIITEIYQEKRDTSMGNAISNGVIVFWVGIDWLRTTVRLYEQNHTGLNAVLFGKIFIALLVFAYGVTIIYLGIKASKTIRYIARIREVSYILIVFTPLFYNPELLKLGTIIAIIVFFPLFYFFVEFLDWITPDPKTYEIDYGKQEKAQAGGQNSPLYTRQYPHHERQAAGNGKGQVRPPFV